MISPLKRPPGFHREWIDQSVEVDAHEEQLFQALSELESWPDWVPGIRAVRRWTSEELAVGSRFTMVVALPGLPSLWLPNRVFKLSPRLLEWGGGGLGSVIRHRFELTPLASGRTRLRHAEYATNALAVMCMPLEPRILRHDMGWTEAIRARFAATAG